MFGNTILQSSSSIVTVTVFKVPMFSVVIAITVTVNASLLSAMVSDTVENSIVAVSAALTVTGVVVTRLKSSTIVAEVPATCKPS